MSLDCRRTAVAAVYITLHYIEIFNVA